VPKFLIDENLSPILAQYLRSLDYKAKALREFGLKGKSDKEIIDYLHQQKVLKSELLENFLIVATKDRYRIRKFG